MVLKCVEDVLLKKVAEAFQELATCILQYMSLTLSSSSSQTSSLRLLERLLLLHCRSKDVFAEFSDYYCLRLLLDIESLLATYFIDLFHQLEWLLEDLLMLENRREMDEQRGNMPVIEVLYHKSNNLLHCIRPAVKSCRYLFAISVLSDPGRFWRFSTQKGMKREAYSYRDFLMDEFRTVTKMLPFVNLDECSANNKVELGKKLGEGAYAWVYEGKFVIRDSSNQIQQISGEPVAVKIFGYDENCTESASSYTSVGSQFFNQMEKMLELKGRSRNTSGMSAEEKSLLEELWKLVSAKHPNIVTAKGYIGKRPQGESGLVMELMSTSLQDYLEEVEEPLQELEIVDLMLEIAKGMRFLHECDFVHKDLKPKNILLRFSKKLGRWDTCAAMEVKLADFGLTERIVKGDGQGSGIDTTPVGTYCYMAPELLRMADYQKSNYQDKVDVFSYGTTCFNILTCNDADALEFTKPYSKAKFYEAVKSNEWRAWVKGKPEYLIDLIARCWEFDPSRRPTFATICSGLHHAMLCILSSPAINVDILLKTHSNYLDEFYRTIVESYALQYKVVGTRMMELYLQDFKNEVTTKIEKSKWSEDAICFLNQLDKLVGGIQTAGRLTEGTVGGLISKLSAAKKKISLKRSKAEEPVFAVIHEENVADGCHSFSKTAVIRVKVQAPTPRFFRIPLTTMDPEWIVSKAMVCCSIFSHFPRVRFSYVEEGPGIQLFPFHDDGAKSDLNVDESLMPFLMCFWESGYIKHQIDPSLIHIT